MTIARDPRRQLMTIKIGFMKKAMRSIFGVIKLGGVIRVGILDH